jgi:eukaryotic-like serine/threonine-protein kinase
VLDLADVTRYELLDRIGVGGMAEIFRGKAVAAGGFEKPVAIKRILPHLSQDKRFVELLIAEAKVLSLLKHRNIVQIFDVGLGDDGQYFLVMEYVDGKDLGAVQRAIEARRRRIPFDLALHIVAEICEALEHAHTARAPDGKSMSLVHRDVSPSNVLMSRAGEVKLTDFGIAKRAEQEATGHGAVRGKFAYISPEQARNEQIDPRSDVFSVGILLWELVTNRRLFSGLGDMEALRAVREAQVPRPRDADSRLTPEIDALIMSALARSSRDRPTAGQLGAQLRTLRYSLDVTVGDPATELAKIIDAAVEVERQSSQQLAQPPPKLDFEGNEATVIRIHTADEFSMRDKDGMSVARARQVIDRFEEEETRQAQLSRDQMAFLRNNAQQDSGDLGSTAEPPLPGVRPRRPAIDAPARAPESLAVEDAPTFLSKADDLHQQFEADEATRLVAPATLRTPAPERANPRRVATQPPPMPSAHPSPRSRDLTPGPAHTPPPGTIHDRAVRGAPIPPPPGSGSTAYPPPPMAMPPQPMRPMPPPPMMAPPPPMMAPPPPMMAPPPPMMAPPPPMMAPPPPMMAPPMQPMPGNFPNWGAPPQPPMGGLPPGQGMYDRPVMQRPATQQVPGLGKSRRTPLKPWMLLIGALVMALLAFAVTRACIHTATTKPPAEAK